MTLGMLISFIRDPHLWWIQCRDLSHLWPRPLWHSVLHRLIHASFQAGTWCILVHTACWQASVHASNADTPHTVTHVWGVISLARPPILRISLFEVHTRSQMKLGSVPPSLHTWISILLDGGFHTVLIIVSIRMYRNSIVAAASCSRYCS